MLAYCKLTGHRFNFGAFSGIDTPSVATLHPAFFAPIETLAKCAAQFDSLSNEDKRLLYFVLLYKLSEQSLLIWNAPPVWEEATANWLDARADLLVAILQKFTKLSSAHPLRRLLPHLRIDAETSIQSVASWLESVSECLDTTRDDTLHAANKAREQSLRISLEQAVNSRAPSKSRAARLQTLVRSVISTLPEITPVRAEFYSKIILTPHKYEASQLRHAREIILEYFPETLPTDKADKDDLLATIDAAFLEREALAKAIGMSDKINQELASMLVATHTEQVGERVFVTSAHKKLSAALTGFINSQDAAPVTYHPTPTKPPVESDYPSKAAFIIAQTRWKAANKRG